MAVVLVESEKLRRAPNPQKALSHAKYSKDSIRGLLVVDFITSNANSAHNAVCIFPTLHAAQKRCRRMNPGLQYNKFSLTFVSQYSITYSKCEQMFGTGEVGEPIVFAIRSILLSLI